MSPSSLQKTLKELTLKGVSTIALNELAKYLEKAVDPAIHAVAQHTGTILHVPHLFQFCMAHPISYAQGAVGRSPSTYLKLIDPYPSTVPSGGIDLTSPITREQARTLCSDPSVDPLAAYAIAMAWGAQNLNHFRLSKDHGNLRTLIEELRASERTQGEDFHRAKELLHEVPGIGISYFTKLLYLCRPTADAYILDQWTAKGIDLLLQDSPVELSSWGGPASWTTREDYERYCLLLDDLATLLGPDWTGERVEQALFDRRGGDWRNYVRACFDGAEGEPSEIQPIREHHLGHNSSRNLAEEILVAHTEGADLGQNLPKGDIPAIHEGKTPRVYCGRHGHAEWYYWVNQGSVRIGLFYPHSHVTEYDTLRQGLGVTSHDFGNGISGNGDQGGVTRTISTSISRGSSSDPNDYQEIAEEAVKRMAELLVTLKI